MGFVTPRVAGNPAPWSEREDGRVRARPVGAAALLAAVLVVAGIVAPPLVAGETVPWVNADFSQVRLISATRAVGEGGSVQLGLQIRLDRGWKTYWRSPGDAGVPPHLDWTGSVNLAAVALAWPAPRRFSVAGYDSLGYMDEVVLPLTVTLARPGEALALRLSLAYATCAELCFLHQVDLVLDVPAGPPAPKPFARLIERYRERVPVRDGADPLTSVRARMAGSAAEPRLEVTVALSGASKFDDPDVFVEGPADVSFAAPRVRVADGGQRATFTMRIHARQGAPDLAGRKVILTLVDGVRAIERTAMVARGG